LSGRFFDEVKEMVEDDVLGKERFSDFHDDTLC
jgi:hypothetical protein